PGPDQRVPVRLHAVRWEFVDHDSDHGGSGWDDGTDGHECCHEHAGNHGRWVVHAWRCGDAGAVAADQQLYLARYREPAARAAQPEHGGRGEARAGAGEPTVLRGWIDGV